MFVVLFFPGWKKVQDLLWNLVGVSLIVSRPSTKSTTRWSGKGIALRQETLDLSNFSRARSLEDRALQCLIRCKVHCWWEWTSLQIPHLPIAPGWYRPPVAKPIHLSHCSWEGVCIPTCTRWAPASYKWSYNPYKCPYKMGNWGYVTPTYTGYNSIYSW